MGRYPTWERKSTVEDSIVLDSSAMYHSGILRLDGAASGTWKMDEGRSTIAYHRIGERLYLDYSVKGQAVAYMVKLAAIPLRWNNGTARLVFECPAKGCERRAYKLYLAPGGLYFACRQCNKLGYDTQLYHPGTLVYQLVTMYSRTARHRETYGKSTAKRG